jgi:hypothetical protein
MSEAKNDNHSAVTHIEDGEILPTSKEQLHASLQEFSDSEAAMTTWQAVKAHKRILMYCMTYIT